VTDSKQSEIIWRKSTASGASGECVEVAVVDDSVRIRNSRDPLSSLLSFTRQEWAAFLESVKNGGVHAQLDRSNILRHLTI
jgi:hypothetical protein